jgi:parallel beta-helix repeat protein
MKGIKISTIFLCVLMMLSIFLIFQEEAKASTIDYIQIRDASGGAGNVVTTGTYHVWDLDHFYAAAYNASGGYLGDVEVDWSSNNTAVGNVTTPGVGTNFTAQHVPNDSTCFVTATYNVTISNSTGLLTVLAPRTDWVLIRDAPGGGGINLCDPANYPIYQNGAVDTFYGAEYNNTAGYIGSVPVTSTWTSNDTAIVDVTSPGSSTTVTCDIVNSGWVWINLDDGSGHSNTTKVTVMTPTYDYIEIRTASGGGGINLCDPANYPTYSYGTNGTFWGAAYNFTAGFIGDLPSSATWTSSTPSIVTVTSPDNPTFFQCSYSNNGSAWITLDDGLGHTNSTLVTVGNGSSGTVDYIQIRDRSGGGGSVVVDVSYVKGDTDTFWAAGYNTSTGYIADVSVTWDSTDFGVGTVTTPGSSTTFTAVGGGNCTVSADYGGGITDTTGLLTVWTVDFIHIKDAPNDGGSVVYDKTYYIGQNDTFWAAGYNNTYGYLGDLYVSWNSTNTSVGTVAPSGSSTYLQPVGLGTCVVEAYHGSGVSDTTGTLSVITYNVDEVIIRDSPNGGGFEVSEMTYLIGATDTFYAAGYNDTIGYFGDVMVNWTSDKPGVGSVNPTLGTSTTFSAIGPGTCIVTADYGGGITDTTGTLSVVAIDYILIRDAPNGGGWEVENMFFYTWQNNVSFYAAAYNNTYGYLGATSVSWSSSDVSVGTVTTPGTATIFNPVGNGTCVVTATYNVTISDNTGILTVSSSTVDYILIRDAPGGFGNEVFNYEYQKGEEDIYYGAMYNNIVGYLADVPSKSNWSSSDPSIVSVTNPGNSTTITCSNTNSGNVTITLWAFGLFETDYANVTVLDWTIDYISIRDAPGSSGNVIGDKTYCVWETDTFYVVAFNYTQGYVKDAMASWVSSDINVGTVTTPGSSTIFYALWVTTDDTCYVTATYDTYSNTTGFLTVLTPRTDYIQIRSEDDGGGGEISSISYHKGDTDTFYGASYNNTVDFIGAVSQTSIWTSSDVTIVTVTSPGNSSDISCSHTNGGTVTVTLTEGGNEYITTVTVLNWTVDYILIRDSSLGGGLDLTDPTNYPSYPVGHQTTFYGAMYNYTGGYIGDVASISIWTSNNTVIVEVTSPGSDSTITCSDTNYGVVEIELEDSMSNTAITQVTVLEPTMDYIQIRDAANGMGSEVGDVSYEIGETDTFYAAAYNNTALYLYDVSVDWSSDDEDVGTVTTPGSSTTFTAEGVGTCTVTASYSGGLFTDTTGTITVTLPSNITVDDSGGAHFTSIQEAINNAKDGDTVFVYAGTYNEHLTITKSITLMGEDKDDTIIDGDDYGKVIFVPGDNVSISGFTIQDGEYAIYLEESDSTSITYNIIQGYEYGIYCNYTIDAYIAHNTITEGEYGIVTFHANNDAIRWNTISYNTEYGAKDYNSSLKNCFNWNYFYNNKVAYWYDPDPDFPILEFDGNILEDNDIAIMVENTSAISITNNTASNNRYGVYLINASPNIADNTISDSDYGIYSDRSSPTISDNEISDSSEYGIYAKDGESLRIINNTMENSEMIFFDSIIKELWLKDSSITKVNTTIENSYVDEVSSLIVQWSLRVRIVDAQGDPIGSAVILVYDANDVLVSASVTDPDGYTDLIPLAEELQTGTTTVYYNPYSIKVVKDSQTSTQELTIEEDTDLVISLSQEIPIVTPSAPKFPWALVLMIGFIGAFGVSALLLEVLKYGIISLFIPLYSRISKDKLLDQPTRYKIFGYIIGNPGAHFGLIKDDLDLGSGQLVYHLKQLEEAHMVYSREDGVKKRFYPAEVPRSKKATPNISDIQEEILGIVEDNSGIVQKKIASSVGISRQVAGYHLTKMEQKGLIDKEVVGREAKYYASRKYSV